MARCVKISVLFYHQKCCHQVAFLQANELPTRGSSFAFYASASVGGFDVQPALNGLAMAEQGWNEQQQCQQTTGREAP